MKLVLGLKKMLRSVTVMTAVKTALATSVAWWLAVRLVGPAKPYMAALAAILSLNVTVADSVSRGLQRILGVLGGIAMAVLMAAWWGMNTWTVGLLVLFGLGMGRMLGMGALGTPQVAISGLMVWSMGHHRELGYAFARFADTVVGATVAVLINGLIHPVDLSPDAIDAAVSLLAMLAKSLTETSQALAETSSLKPEDLRRHGRMGDQGIVRLRQAIGQAEESLRWNVWARSARNRLRRVKAVEGLLERSHTQVRAMARMVGDLQGGGAGQRMPERALAEVIKQASVSLTALAEWLNGERLTPEWEALVDTERRLQAYWKEVDQGVDLLQRQLWAVALTCGRMVDDQRTFLQKSED